jgi:hypothetical protein
MIRLSAILWSKLASVDVGGPALEMECRDRPQVSGVAGEAGAAP